MIVSGRRRERPLLQFVELDLFVRSREDVLSDEDLDRVEDELHENPYAGDLVPGTGGVRKLRAAVAGRGKRGSARVLYYFVDSRLTVYFLLAYAKNETRDLSPAGKQRLHQLVQIIKTEKE